MGGAAFFDVINQTQVSNADVRKYWGAPTVSQALRSRRLVWLWTAVQDPNDLVISLIHHAFPWEDLPQVDEHGRLTARACALFRTFGRMVS